jgi:hypothetical protein
LVQRELAKAQQQTSSTTTSDGRRWPTPAVTKALLAAYEMAVHRFPTFLRCLEAAPGQDASAGADASAAPAGGANKTGEQRWETSRVNFGTGGWRLLAEGDGGKKHK